MLTFSVKKNIYKLKKMLNLNFRKRKTKYKKLLILMILKRHSISLDM